MNDITLTDMLLSLKRELAELRAREKAEGETLLSVEEIVVELEVVASASREGKGGIAFWVVSGEKSSGSSSGHTQRVQITLKPSEPLDLGS